VKKRRPLKRLIGRLAGPNGKAVIEVRRGEVIRLVLPDGNEYTATTGTGTFETDVEALVPGTQTQVFPAEIWAMDAQFAVYLEAIWRRAQKPLAAAWNALKDAMPTATDAEIADVFEAAISNAMAEGELPVPVVDPAEFKRQTPVAMRLSIARFARMKRAEGMVPRA
jgi:hypothetical protein